MRIRLTKQQLVRRKATVGVVGLGYVGMPTVLAMTKKGIRVIGVDVNKQRVAQLRRGESFIADIPAEAVKQALAHFTPTTDWQELRKAQVIVIAVPTPLTPHKTPDTSAIESAGKNAAKYLRRGTLVLLESTTYPGTTEELLQPILEARGLAAGKDFFLAFAPERVDPGNKRYAFEDIPKVVGGIDRRSTELAAAFYLSFLKKVHTVSSPKAAEMTKLLENIFRLVNISLVNELKMVSDRMNIDFWEVIEAAKTKPYGFMPFYPGPGVGGHCIPLDPFYLSWKAREYNFFTRFIDLAGEINDLMPHQVLTKIIWVLNLHRKPVRGSKIFVLGAAYKKDIDDPRESPTIPILRDLLRKGALAQYHDPFIPALRVGARTLRSVTLTKRVLRAADCVVILTDHSQYDYRLIAKTAKLVVDTRGAVKTKSSKIFR